MHTRGMYFYEENRACIEFMLLQEIEEARVRWREVVGVPETTKVTPTNMRAAIFTKHKRAGIPCCDMPDPVNIPDFTNPTKDMISVKKGPLLRMIVSPHSTPQVLRIVEAWWRFKKAEKKLGYVQSEDLLAAVDPADNMYRTGWNSCGTDTGRFTGGVTMTMPQDLRYIFGPAPGRAWVHFDKEQLEIRIMACVANDRKLQSIIASGKDLYTEEAKEYFNLPPETTKKTIKQNLRQGAKIIRLARQYWAQEKTCFSQAIAQDRTMTISKIRALIEKFDTTYSDTVQYWKNEKALVAIKGYSEDRLHGRRRVYPRMPDDSEIVNWPVQATAAAVMNEEFLELNARLEAEMPDSYLITQLHDAGDIDCDEDDIDKVIALVKEVTDTTKVINGVEMRLGISIKVATHDYFRRAGDEYKGDTWASV